jgi:hypothetical protein
MAESELDEAKELIEGFVTQLKYTGRKSWDGTGVGGCSSQAQHKVGSDSLGKGRP